MPASADTRGRGSAAHVSERQLADFRSRVWSHYREHGRHDLPWRLTRDPYAILVSEVMLQQTQVARVIPYFEAFMAEFPTVDSLAAAQLERVLCLWQGLGYNRRAVWLKRAAETLSGVYGGQVPNDRAVLESLAGVGPATASGVLAFAFGEPEPYLETNVRAVYLHEFFPECDGVSDREVMRLVEATLDRGNPREWFYALLDYGSWLKRSTPNPSRRSAHHARQSVFEGSRRQKRAHLLRAVLAAEVASADELAAKLEADALSLSPGEAIEVLEELEREGFVCREAEGWRIARDLTQ